MMSFQEYQIENVWNEDFDKYLAQSILKVLY